MTSPRFDDGDVEIHLNPDHEPFILHTYVLALHSPWFKASLSNRWNYDMDIEEDAQQPSRRYELRFKNDTSEGSLMRDGIGGLSASKNTESINN